MIHIKTDGIKPNDSTVKVLSELQQSIDREPDFPSKAAKAKSSWIGKLSTPEKRAAFNNIKLKLKEACVGVEICNYCEQSEATDIEHIFPKKLFPHKTFVWDNYLLACKNCNTGFKLDSYAIFNPVDSSTLQVFKSRTVYPKPETEDTCFINPRTEDPLKFLWLNLPTGILQVHPEISDTDSRNYKKASYTLHVLGLENKARPALIDQRLKITGDYVRDIKMYSKIRAAINFEELKKIVHYPDAIDETQNFADEKTIALKRLKTKILTRFHPTVWHELLRQSKMFPTRFSEGLYSSMQVILTETV